MTLCVTKVTAGHARCRESTLYGVQVQAPTTQHRLLLGRKLRLDTYNFRGDSLGSQDLVGQGSQRLAMSLFTKVANLPPHGKNMTAEEERRQANSLLDHTPIYVWEAKCRACLGCGTIRTMGPRSKRTLGVCLKCEGIGFVRHIASEMDDDAADFTIARPGNVVGPHCDLPQKPIKK